MIVGDDCLRRLCCGSPFRSRAQFQGSWVPAHGSSGRRSSMRCTHLPPTLLGFPQLHPLLHYTAGDKNAVSAHPDNKDVAAARVLKAAYFLPLSQVTVRGAMFSPGSDKRGTRLQLIACTCRGSNLSLLARKPIYPRPAQCAGAAVKLQLLNSPGILSLPKAARRKDISVPSNAVESSYERFSHRPWR